jgi:hypothetical protein
MTHTEREAQGLFDTLDASTGRVLGRETAMHILLAALTRAEARGRAEGLREAAGIATGVDQEDPTVAGHAALFKTISRVLARAGTLDAAEKGEAV